MWHKIQCRHLAFYSGRRLDQQSYKIIFMKHKVTYLSFQMVFSGMPVCPAILNISIGEVTTHWQAPAVAPAAILLGIDITPFLSVSLRVFTWEELS